MTSTLIARSEARRRFASVWNGASPASRRAGAFARVTLQQSLRVLRREPPAVFRDADGHNFVFRLIDCIHDGRRRQQRHFMLAAASAKEDANPKLCHDISVWR